jgi:hypothetical protein
MLYNGKWFTQMNDTFHTAAETQLAPVGRGPGRRFEKGHKKLGGRPKGRGNKVHAEMAQLAAEVPDGEDGRPRDPLAVLEWAMLHPKASLHLVILAADKLASYRYAKKRDITSGGESMWGNAEMVARLHAWRARNAQARDDGPPKPAAEPAPAPTETLQAERIRVRLRSNGKTGTVLASDFNPEKYERL